MNRRGSSSRALRANTAARPHPQPLKTIKVDTGGLCIFCYQESPEEDNVDKEEICSRYMRMTSRYLKINFFAHGGKSEVQQLGIDHGKFQITACDSCLVMMTSFLHNHEEMEKSKLKLEYDLWRISKVMRCAEKVPSRANGFSKVFTGRENTKEMKNILGFRKQFIHKGLWKNLARPRVALKRFDEKGPRQCTKLRVDVCPSLWKQRTPPAENESDLQCGRELTIPLLSPSNAKKTGGLDNPGQMNEKTRVTRVSVTRRPKPLAIRNTPSITRQKRRLELEDALFEKILKTPVEDARDDLSGNKRIRRDSPRKDLLAIEAQENRVASTRSESEPVEKLRKSDPEVVDLLSSDDDEEEQEEIEVVSETMNAMTNELYGKKSTAASADESVDEGEEFSDEEERIQQTLEKQAHHIISKDQLQGEIRAVGSGRCGEHLSSEGNKGNKCQGVKTGHSAATLSETRDVPRLPEPIPSAPQRPRPRAMPLSVKKKLGLPSIIPPNIVAAGNDVMTSNRAVKNATELTGETIDGPVGPPAFTPAPEAAPMNCEDASEIDHGGNQEGIFRSMDHHHHEFLEQNPNGPDPPIQIPGDHDGQEFIEDQQECGGHDEGAYHEMPYQHHHEYPHVYNEQEPMMGPVPDPHQLHTVSYEQTAVITITTSYRKTVEGVCAGHVPNFSENHPPNFPQNQPHHPDPEHGHEYAYEEEPMYQQQEMHNDFPFPHGGQHVDPDLHGDQFHAMPTAEYESQPIIEEPDFDSSHLHANSGPNDADDFSVGISEIFE